MLFILTINIGKESRQLFYPDVNSTFSCILSVSPHPLLYHLRHTLICVLIIIMYIYHALINALSAHMIHINLNMIFYTHVKHSPTKTIYIKYYLENK